MAGRPQKPASQLQNKWEGRVERRTFPVSVPREPLVAPPLPRGLRGAGALMWEAYWTDPVCLASTGVDGYDIGRYCLLLTRRESEERKARSEGATIEGMNGPMLNPRYRAIKELTREIEKLREQLGILPLARMRLGLTAVQGGESGIQGLRDRLDRANEARDVIEGEATEVVDLDKLG